MGKGIIMADSDDQNTTDKNKQLPTFSTLKVHEQLAIQLRSEGQGYRSIVDQLKVDYDLQYKEGTLREWFMAGGRLEVAYYEYLDFAADESVKQAKLKIKQLSLKAANKLETLMDSKDTADNIVERAARTVLNKYIPDRQVIIDEAAADEIPSAISDAGDKVLTETPGDTNGSDEMANTPQGEPASPNPGE